MTDHIELTETSRLRVEHDEDAGCPRGDWDMLTGFVKIQGRGDSRLADVPAVHPDVYRLAEAHDRFLEIYYRSPAGLWDRTGAPDPEEVVVRYAKIFHNKNVEYDAEHGGYWFVQWNDEISGDFTAEGEVITQEQETYRQWAEGEVYGVILERLVAWAKLSADGGTVLQGREGTVRESWEQADGDSSIWGCYLDEKYTAQVVAKEYFDLTDEETTALGLS